jgi:inorganic pyrophosphatase
MLAIMSDCGFWARLDELMAMCELTIDRPEGSPHPRYAEVRYPLDYGYLERTQSGDGDGIDVWIGSMPGKSVSAIICTVDLEKRDAEVKILLGCTRQEAREILTMHNTGSQSAILTRI